MVSLRSHREGAHSAKQWYWRGTLRVRKSQVGQFQCENLRAERQTQAGWGFGKFHLGVGSPPIDLQVGLTPLDSQHPLHINLTALTSGEVLAISTTKYQNFLWRFISYWSLADPGTHQRGSEASIRAFGNSGFQAEVNQLRTHMRAMLPQPPSLNPSGLSTPRPHSTSVTQPKGDPTVCKYL